MPRLLRVDVGNIIYHVLNRTTARLSIFDCDNSYQLFINTLAEAKKKYPMRLLSYCLMPNHWHLVLHPEEDHQLVPFMHWLSMTHTHRWHAVNKTTGTGHLYQGRYKSFPVQTDEYFMRLVRYVERNAQRANLVKKAEDWQWGSLYLRERGTEKAKELLNPWLVERGNDYLKWVNTPETEDEIEALRTSVKRGRPYGDDDWSDQMAVRLKLDSTFKDARGGRPKNRS